MGFQLFKIQKKAREAISGDFQSELYAGWQYPGMRKFCNVLARKHDKPSHPCIVINSFNSLIFPVP